MVSLRNDVLDFATRQLGCTPDSPWPDKPGYLVLRHPQNGKWAGIIMDIPARCIAIGGDEVIEIVNVKLDPVLVSALRTEEGYAPAWHLNKTHWLTVRLDGSVSADKVCALLEMSFNLVGPKTGRATN